MNFMALNKSVLVYKIESLIPEIILKRYRKLKRYLVWKNQQYLYRKEEVRLTKVKKQLNVIFLVLYPSVWKYDSVYKLMLLDERFRPQILICPVVDRGVEHMRETLHGAKELFEKKGYNTVCAYDENNGTYIDISQLSPDIIFYSFQWSNHVDKRYNVYSLRKYLKCYVNYSFKNNPYEWSIASPVQGLMWIYFSECEENKKLAMSYNAKEFRKNICVVGYPMYDEYQSAIGVDSNWKIKDDTNLKKVIWAPHHTIDGCDGLIKLSTFLLYAEEMLKIAYEYRGTMQFVFKPHPQLKPALYEHKDWGKERTDNYYRSWGIGENTNICEDAYIDLFKTSDAMIHDCGSFIVEYLYTMKPVMFLDSYNREEQSNEVGKKAYKCHYHGKSISDIKSFLTEVVLEKKDPKFEERRIFYNTILVPPKGESVARNIINEILNRLKIEQC